MVCGENAISLGCESHFLLFIERTRRERQTLLTPASVYMPPQLFAHENCLSVSCWGGECHDIMCFCVVNLQFNIDRHDAAGMGLIMVLSEKRSRGKIWGDIVKAGSDTNYLTFIYIFVCAV